MGNPQGKGGCDHNGPLPPARHDAGNCDLCKAILGLAAIITLPPPPPAAANVCGLAITASPRLAVDTTRGCLGSRAPPVPLS
jgi:hypothetical protein